MPRICCSDPDADIRVTLIEKRPAFGQGIAYSTTLDDHVLNVSAFGMSAYADDPEHFWRWLQQQGRAPEKNPRKIYVPRHVYADYLASVLDGLRAGGGSERPAAYRCPRNASRSPPRPPASTSGLPTAPA